MDKIKKLIGNEVKAHHTTWTVVDEVHDVAPEVERPSDKLLPNFEFGSNWQFIDLFLHLYPGDICADIARANS